MKKLLLVCFALMMLFAASAVAESDGSEIHISGQCAYRLLDDGTAYVFRYLGDPGDGIFPPHEIDGYPTSYDENIANGVYVPEFYSWAIETFVPFSYTLMEDGTAELCYSLTPDTDEYPIPEYIEGFRVSSMSPYYRETRKTCGDFDYYIRNDGTAEIISWTGKAGSDLIIPEQLDGYPVTVIGAKVLRGDIYRASVQRIFIPKTVTTIRSRAIPSSNITEIVVATDNPVYTVQDGMLINRQDQAVVRYASQCEQTAVQIPEGIQLIHDDAFSGALHVTSIILPDSVKKIGVRALYMHVSLEKLVVPATIEYTGERAIFRSGETLIITKGDSGASVMGNNSFLWMQSETGDDPASFLSEPAAEQQQSAVDWDFITDFRFVQLEEVPAGFAMVGDCLYSKWDKRLLKYCPQGEAETGTFVIPAGTESIADDAFSATEFSSFVLPESVTRVWDNAFSGCKFLKEVVLPQQITAIGSNAYANCTSLESIVLPDGVTSIGSGAFSRCGSLKSIVVPKGVTIIEDSTFMSSGLESIVLPDGLIAIEGRAFTGCDALESISIPETVTAIGGAAFNNCTSLRSVTLPEGIDLIPRGAFAGCKALESVNIPASVTQIDKNAFGKCNPVYTVVPGTYGESWCMENGFNYVYAD